MLQSIQFNGSGPPTYVYSKKAVGTTNEFYHVFATETRGYDGRNEGKQNRKKFLKEEQETDSGEKEEYKVVENRREDNLREVYEKEYGRRESFLWKLR